jgi:hypothetical protein
MMIDTKKILALACSVLTVATLVVSAAPARSSDLSKLGKAITYPVRKVGNNASVNTHRVLQKNSVEKSSSPQSPNMVVKPDGHKTPVNGS